MTCNDQGPWGSTRNQEAEVMNLYCRFPGKAWQGTSLGLASVNNVSSLWGIWAVPSCQLPGPGVIRAGG